MKFKPSLAAEEFIESVHQRIGARNKAVLGRSALFLALGEGVPSNFKSPEGQGKDLDDETVIGDELREVVRAALNHRAGQTLEEEAYRRQFRLHFEYGCQRLQSIWEESGRDQTRFVGALLKLCGDELGGAGKAGGDAATSKPRAVVENAVKLKLLVDAEEWTINQAGGNGLLVISGQPGSGKSQLALDLLAQVARQGVRFIFFDLKGELEAAGDDAVKAANRQKFFDLTGADYVRLIDSRLPVNPLYAGKTAPETANIASRVASLVRSFGPQMGPNQEDAIRQAYAQLSQPDFAGLVAALQSSGSTGVAVSVLSKIVDLGIFADAKEAQPFEDWLRRPVVIDFKPLDNDTRALAVAFILNYFIERLNRNLSVRNDVQPLQMVLFVDEAHNILPKDGKARLLEKLAREGRSWGFPLWLASQDADKFMSASVDFAELAAAGLHFSPQTLSAKEQKQILGGVAARQLEKGEAALRRAGYKLQLGEARQFWRDGGR
ncbi:MAG: DndE family protein [Verrucomicrobia bacterium]|nr:DndE family protein [Verrucomicrobiota bacterium]